jgi:hypothetical protein
MKNTNCKILSFSKSAKNKTASLSLPILPLFEISGNTFIYYNKSPFIQKLKRIKFKFVRFVQPFHFVINLGCFPKIVRYNRIYSIVSHSTHQLSFNF